MSADSSPTVDVWRAVSARRLFEGRAPLTAFQRLGGGLADTEGACSYQVQFERDRFQTAVARVQAEAQLPLICQRSLQRFVLPVRVEQTLGLIRREDEESGLPPGVEPLLVPPDGEVALLDLIEDELILSLPVVPVDPDSAMTGPAEVEAASAEATDAEAEPRRENPFAALSALKLNKP